MSDESNAFRRQAEAHDKRADEMVSGDKKDNHIVAARNNRKAAAAIEQAEQSTRKAEAL